MPNVEFNQEKYGEQILINTMEEIVKETVDEVILSMNMCTCQICRLNACAIALNKIPPCYVTTEKGKAYSKVPGDKLHYHIQVLVEVTKALMIVKKNPKH